MLTERDSENQDRHGERQRDGRRGYAGDAYADAHRNPVAPREKHSEKHTHDRQRKGAQRTEEGRGRHGKKDKYIGRKEANS